MASHPAVLSWTVLPSDEYGLALWSAPAIEAATGGRASDDFEASGVAFDSREVGEGDLFVALYG
jgi:UDP-N-acetylmuramoyl-tripeptide--D-alanyl-D-alanine ligase